MGQNRGHRDSRPETIRFNGSVWRDSHGVSVDWHRLSVAIIAALFSISEEIIRLFELIGITLAVAGN